MTGQLSLDAGEAHGHLCAARVHLVRALEATGLAARSLEAALRLQPRDRKGRPLSASALRLWGATTAVNTAAMHLRRALATCEAFIEESRR